MKLAAYARYSTDMQRHESVTAQFRAIEAYCAAQEHEIVARYADEAVSGKSVHGRKEFQKMLAAAKRREFDGIIVYYISRLSRSLEDHVLLERDLRKLGIPILSVKEPNADTPNGRMVRGIMQVLSQHESEQIAERVAYGMRESALQCKFMGGVVPLGWNVDKDNRFVINEKEADAVREAFRMYAEGHSLGEILDMFDQRQIVGRRNGLPYTKTALYEILHSRRYTGEYVFNKGRRGDHRTPRDDGETIVISDGMPRIVSDELFEIVQKKNAINKRMAAKRQAKHIYLLTGLAFCGICGAPLIGVQSQSRKPGEKYYYYRCSESIRRNGTCGQLAVSAGEVENRVTAALEKHVFSDHGLETIARKYHDMLVANDEGRGDRIREQRQQENRLTREIGNLTAALASLGVSAALTDALRKKERELANTQAAIKAEMRAEKDIPSAKEIRAQLRALQSAKGLTRMDMTRLLNALVKRVEIKKDESDVAITVHVEFVFTKGGSGGRVRAAFNACG